MSSVSARALREAPVAVLGAGSWGTALAIQFAHGGRAVRLWGRDRAQLLVKAPAAGPDRTAAVRAVRHAVEAVAGAREHRGVAFSVDVDPQ